MEINAENKEMFLEAYSQLKSKLSFMQAELAWMEHTKQRLEALEAIMATAEKNERGAFVDRKISSRVTNMNYEMELRVLSAYPWITGKSIFPWGAGTDEQKGQ